MSADNDDRYIGVLCIAPIDFLQNVYTMNYWHFNIQKDYIELTCL